jgi:DNA adenine methylase
MVATRLAALDAGAGPFLKWAGGKTQLLADILKLFPDHIATYYEPFVGGGAVFFALAEQQRFDRAVLSDRNEDLVELYTAVRDEVEPLIAHLALHEQAQTSEEYFYRIRALDKSRLDPVSRAARLIFLNRTCYNGLYRVNRRGEFNVPFGRYKSPNVCNRSVLRAASRALQNVEIRHDDFETVAKEAGRGDTIYFDPPYHPVSATSSFSAYHSLPFGQDDHRRLARTMAGCAARGAVAVLSNSDTPFTREVFGKFDLRTVLASRAINSVASRRGRVSEILVRAQLSSRPGRSSALT